MKAEIYWIKGIDCRLGTMPRPRGGDWLEEELDSLKQEGVDVIISLLEMDEIEALEIVEGERLCKIKGIDFISFPISDGSVPKQVENVRELSHQIREMLRQGQGVAIHCRSGIGRSSLLAACVMADMGIKAENALALIEDARGISIPDTETQRKWILQYASENPVCRKNPADSKEMF